MSLRPSVPPSLRPASDAGRRRALISLTPLIDVVFILLVFFMLASSFLDWRAIELDAPATAGGGSGLEGALLVEVRPEGLRLSGERIAPEALARRLAETLERRPDQRVLVKPAGGVVMEDVVAVLDLLAAVGVSDLALMDEGRS